MIKYFSVGGMPETANGVKRMSLFNRRFALSRKAALVRSGRRDAEGFDDLDEYFAPSVEEEERALMSTDQENIMLDDDNEVTFRPTLKVVKSSPSVREVPLDASIQDYDATPLRRHVEMEVPLKDEHDYGYEGMEMEMEEMKEMKDTGSIKKPKKTKSKTSRSIRSRIESIVMDEDDQNDDEGTRRRSKRKKIAPLAYWKNDRVVYGRRQSSRMPVIVDVLRKEEADQIAGRNGRPRSKNKRQTAERLRAVGFKAKVAVTGTVMDYDTRNETERLIAIGPEQIETNRVAGEDFGIQTIFTEGTFLSSGILEFPTGSTKPTRNSSKHSLVFYVIEGTVEVTIHLTSFVVGTGCQFIVPRGNQYSIRSVWNRTSRLFFCHCKDTSE